MIGKIYSVLFPYYNNKTLKMDYKKRPALIIAKADYEDYVVLPVSKITIKNNIDTVYDIKIDPALFPNSNLRQISYIRTHKQTITNKRNLASMICDLKTEYPDKYKEIINLREQFSKDITKQALK